MLKILTFNNPCSSALKLSNHRIYSGFRYLNFGTCSRNVISNNLSTFRNRNKTTFSMKLSQTDKNSLRNNMSTISKSHTDIPINYHADIQVNSVLTTKRIVGWWLIGSGALVFSTVVLGGLTRLTESGLSMIDWSFLGSRPPSTQKEWEDYFDRYKQFPEYKLLNQGMNLEEFKKIYWYEYSHRMLGRIIGAFVALPGMYFVLKKGYCTPAVKKAIIGVTGLVGFQGFLGWYMVKSGLDDQIVEKNEVPRVSHYRLAAHLGTAFTIYLLALSTGLTVLRVSKRSAAAAQLNTAIRSADSGVSRKFKQASKVVSAMIFGTAISGAFVAGLDAGLVYNSFPKMGGNWIPSDIAALTPGWINVFENPTTVQFNHRYFAMTTYGAILALWMYGRRQPISKEVKRALNALVGVGSLQVALGITTLIWLVPIPLASMHQGGSLTLLSVAAWLLNALKYAPK